MQLDIDDYRDFIKTYQAKDVSGKLHVFEIEKQIFPMGIKWVAHEIKSGKVEGYQFALYAELDDNPVDSLQKLYRKINKGLSKKYIKRSRRGGYISYSLPEHKFVGRIEWDEDYHGEIPKLVIDGKTYTWHDIGRMLMTYEGWIVKLKINETGEDEV